MIPNRGEEGLLDAADVGDADIEALAVDPAKVEDVEGEMAWWLEKEAAWKASQEAGA